MKVKRVLSFVVASAVGMAMALSVQAAEFPPKENAWCIQSAEFFGMQPPSSINERADIYTRAQMKVTYKNGKSKSVDLKYHQLMGTTDVIKGNVVGGLWDRNHNPIPDSFGQMASDSPDGNSLIDLSGKGDTHEHDQGGGLRNPHLRLITHFEYRELPPNYPKFTPPYISYWSKLPAAMGISRLEQDSVTGALKVMDYSTISFADADGGWIHCAASLSPWNTHLGSEEYEPDAKVRGGFANKAADSDDTTDINSFSKYYFGDPGIANPYRYGLVPEVSISRDGAAIVRKHYSLGRIARELVDVQPDRRTVYMGDDGAYTGLFMFAADHEGDLSEGTLYAAKWKQTSDANGGSADLSWIRLGHGSDKEIKAMVDGGINFGRIFDVRDTYPGDPTYKKVKTYTGTEWLRLKDGMEKAAAFLETRRYAALKGATTEFTKMEGVTHNARDKKAYVVVSRVETGMLASSTDPQDDIHVVRNDGGAIYEMELTDGQKDTEGRSIPSRYVAKNMTGIPELRGGWLGLDRTGRAIRDAEGNRCRQDMVCGGDNIKYGESMRTLFIGEDTSRRNNNYVWAFNIDTRQLSRILSVPMYGEVTGLQAIEDLNGYGYIMSSFQHPGEEGQKGEFPGAPGITEADVLHAIDIKWKDRKKAAIGYIGTNDGALPGMRCDEFMDVYRFDKTPR